jgi:hypothetical protein
VNYKQPFAIDYIYHCLLAAIVIHVFQNEILIYYISHSNRVESDLKPPNLPLSLRFKGAGCHYNTIKATRNRKSSIDRYNLNYEKIILLVNY